MAVPDESDLSDVRLAGIIGLEEDSDAPADRTVDRLTYRIFIGIVSLNALVVLIGFYLIPLPQPAKEVLWIVDTINALIFLGDFCLRLFTSANKARYLFVEWGWIDLLGSLPFHPLLRLLRILRSIGLWYRLARDTDKAERDDARRRLAESTLLAVAAVVVMVVTLGSLAISLIEPEAPGANIHTGSDAVWYVIVTIATVGYGDKYPVTNEGRIIGVILIIMGVSAFSVLTSYIATRFLARARGGI
jgi:voltage-gated potassium channel